MRVIKTLLVFALLIPWGALAQTPAAGSCGTYPMSSSGRFASTWVFVWFAAQGDPTTADIANSPGWKSWITVTNLAQKEGVSVRFDFLQATGGGYGQGVWLTTRGVNPRQVMATQFGLSPGETAEVRVMAMASDGNPTSGLAVGSIAVTFTSLDPCDLDVQGKLSLTFVCINVDGKVTRLGTVDAIRLDVATNSAFTNISATPAWARSDNMAVEVPSFAIMNLASFAQDVKVTLIGPDGNPAVAPKYITLAAGAVTGTEVESLFGIDALNTTQKTFVGRLVFEGSAPLAAIALQFVGADAMGSRKVWPF